MGRHYCTFFDSNYLPKGLALYESLRTHDQPFVLWIVCMDRETQKILEELALGNVHLLSLEDLERAVPELKRVKESRTLVEYYFTCTPCVPELVLKADPAMKLLTYVDADIFFFANPSPIFDEMGSDSILVTEHRFAPSDAHRIAYGRFNVGWLSFRRDDRARACLQWWRERCIEWCYDRLEAGRYADQKYLDYWPQLFGGVHVLRDEGAAIAPWNVASCRLRDGGPRLGVLVNDRPLLFYHFHRFTKLSVTTYQTGLHLYGIAPDRVLRNRIYKPYAQAISKWSSIVASTAERIGIKLRPIDSHREPEASSLRVTLRRIAWSCRRARYLAVGWLRGHFFFELGRWVV